jgi:hypothetical protein
MHFIVIWGQCLNQCFWWNFSFSFFSILLFELRESDLVDKYLRFEPHQKHFCLFCFSKRTSTFVLFPWPPVPQKLKLLVFYSNPVFYSNHNDLYIFANSAEYDLILIYLTLFNCRTTSQATKTVRIPNSYKALGNI